MGRMAGYHWVITGAAGAFAAVVALDFGVDVWATHSGIGFLSEIAGVALVSVLFGAYSWIIAFVTVWPFFLLTISLARALDTRSLVYFITCGALTGALLSVPILFLPHEASDQRSLVEIIMWVVPSCAMYGISGAWLFWWKVVRPKPSE